MPSKIAQLSNVAEMMTLVDYLVNAPIGQERMGCFYGPSGWGKTAAVSAAQIAYDVIAIEVIENTSKLYVLEQIIEQLQIRVRRDVPTRIDAIAKHMVQTNRPLIIDDAQYLIKRGMIGIARDIYNRTGGTVPVILVGEEKLPQDLTVVENLHNRIARWSGAKPCEMDDARRLAEVYAEGVEIDDELLAEFVKSANGATRRVANMLGTARELAHSKGNKCVTRADWGNRPFFDGQPPVERKPAQLQPHVALVAPAKKVVRK